MEINRDANVLMAPACSVPWWHGGCGCVCTGKKERERDF